MDRKWRLSHARGYLLLGMYREAASELDDMPIADKECSALRVEILHASAAWPRLRELTAQLIDHEPGEVGWWVSLAFATRRCVSIQEARKVLLDAEKAHGAEAIVQFNLACYACQMGELDEARDRVRRAIRADRHFAEIAKSDTDLAPLRALDPGFPKAR